MITSKQAISYSQKFCPLDSTPFDTKEWEERDVVLESFKGGEVKITFEQKGVLAPKDWSQTAVLIAASKYFRGALNTPERETNVYSMITRVSQKITDEGKMAGYFDSEKSATAFFNDLTWLLLHQHVSFNSPVWFNVGDPNVPQQCSACIPYDGRISTDRGLIPIGEIVRGLNTGESYKVHDPKGNLVPVVTGICNGVRKPIRLNLSDGSSLDLTSDHVVFVQTSSGSILEKQAKDIEEDDHLILQDFDSLRDVEDTYAGSIKVSEDIAWLAGLMVGDGYCGRSASMTSDTWDLKIVTQSEKDRLELVLTLLDITYTVQEKSWGYVFRGYGRVASSLWESLGLWGNTHNKIIPEWVYRSNSKIVGQFLSGLFDADVHTSSGPSGLTRIHLSNTSDDVIYGAQTLLKSLGVSSAVRVSSGSNPRDDGYSRKVCYSLSVESSESVDTFTQYVGFTNSDKSTALAERKAPEVTYAKKTTKVVSKENLGACLVYDIQTECGSFWYEGTLVHNCFILPVHDNMESIMGLAIAEARVFKGGSGAGSDLSRIRSGKETISGTSNTSSGPMSFARIYDQVGQVVKSGGRVRRAAKMQTMHVWHPDIIEFIWAKSKEEKKAKALIQQGYDASLDGEAYSSVFFQNSNFSVRVTDEFMKAVELDQDWWTLDRHGEKFEKHRARDILKQMADCCWECGDPGVQYDGEIQRMHTVPDTDRIWSSNPCQPKDATVLTPEGIKTFGDIDVGSTIWSGQRWTKVTHKVATGTKPVFRYHTRAGSFLGTDNHRVISKGERVEVKDAECIDVAPVKLNSSEDGFDYQTVVDGLFFGDGSYKVQEGLPDYSILYVGEKDKDYFIPERGVSEYINETPFDRTAHRVKTTIQVGELERTHSRVIPKRFVHGSPLQVRSFLRGLYSANGSMAGGRVTLKATSFEVIKDVQQMLSSQGVRSYYTVNKSKEVEFDNGVYVCKQSYDLNITSDRITFQEKIGFIQNYKASKLAELCESVGSHPKASKRSKKSFEVVDREYIGDLPVWDIRVEADEHTYWTGGLLVSNCSEFLHLDNTSCNLASFNLLKFDDAEEGFQIDRFIQACRTMILAMDILVDFGDFPTKDLTTLTKAYRPLGLGYANLGAIIMRRGMAYDSNEARQLCGAITSLLTGASYQMSADLVDVKGAYKGNKVGDNKAHHQNVIQSHYEALQQMDFEDSSMEVQSIVDASTDVWEKLSSNKKGYRNSQATVLAPTGSIALLMDCDTTGIEPEIALVKYKKLVGGGTLTMVSTIFRESLVNLGYSETEIEEISKKIIEGNTAEEAGIKDKHLPIFDCSMAPKPGARTISWQGHAKMMAAAQPFISGAISKTINVPNEFTSEDILDCYFDCWKMGLKAVALYRDGSKSIEPYSASDSSEDGKTATVVVEAKEQPLPDDCRSIRHKFSIMDGIYGGKHTGFIHVGLYDDGRPGEIFIRMAKEGSTVSGLLDGLSMTISKALQHGVPLESLIEKFRDARFSPFGMTRANSPNLKVCSSILDYLGRFLEDKFLQENIEPLEAVEVKPTSPLKLGDGSGPTCTECGTITVRDGKCHVCPNCGTQVGACTG